MSSFDVDAIVIGAGVVGLASARALSIYGVSVLVLERHSSFGSEISARNSEVIHAGIYYQPNSLKARLCVEGKKLLYDFCEAFNVNHKRCGKLIVASNDDQVGALSLIFNTAKANGVDDLVWLSKVEAQSLEPSVTCSAALLSPSTGIIDSHELMLALLGDLECHGGVLALNTPVRHVRTSGDGFEVFTGGSEPSSVRSRFVVNSAGLAAPQLAQNIEGLQKRFIPQTYLAKGNYFSLNCKAPFSRLVYPVPEPGGLGVHFTLDLAGRGRFGPDVEWVDSVDYSIDERRCDHFYASIRRYWPDLHDGALSPAYSGIRPKIAAPGRPDGDFVIQDSFIHGIGGLVNLFGIESPGLTSSFAIGETVVKLLM